MRAVIDLLSAQPSPRLLVIGDMGEVGTDGPRFHAEVGVHARASGVDALYALGDASAAAAAAFGPGARHFDAIEPLIDAMRDWTRAHERGAVAVKGSRFMRMERVVAALAAGAVDAQALH
jgi:UDP-N-acetylmuramoyl-tripeptide--D-alanyl-D-alanine ligase